MAMGTVHFRARRRAHHQPDRRPRTHPERRRAGHLAAGLAGVVRDREPSRGQGLNLDSAESVDPEYESSQSRRGNKKMNMRAGLIALAAITMTFSADAQQPGGPPRRGPGARGARPELFNSSVQPKSDRERAVVAILDDMDRNQRRGS